MKRRLVLRSETLAVKYNKEGYIKIKKKDTNYIIALRHLSELYIYERINISLRTCRKLTGHFPVFIVDARGYIVGRICQEQRDETT